MTAPLPVLKYKHARDGDDSDLTFQITADGSHGAIGPDGVSARVGFPVGRIDEEGWAVSENGSPYRLNATEVAGITYRLTVKRGRTAVSSVTFTPGAAAGEIDVVALLRAGQAQLATPEQLGSLSGMLMEGETLLPELRQSLADTAQSAGEALAVTGINPAYISETTANPPAAPDGTRGAKRTAEGGLVRLERVAGVWVERGEALPGRAELEAMEARRPTYSITAQGNAQAAITAAVSEGAYGVTVDLSRGEAVAKTVTTDGTVSLRGSGGGATGANTLSGTAALGNAPVLAIIPPADNNAREGAVYDSLQVFADQAGGGDAVVVDLSKAASGYRRLAGVTFQNPNFRSANGWALNILNPADGADGYGVGLFLGGKYDGGLRAENLGDSCTFIGGRFTGPRRGFDLSFISDAAVGPGVGDSSVITLLAMNSTALGGNRIGRATRLNMKGLNLESKHGAGYRDATFWLEGGPGDPIQQSSLTDSLITGSGVKYALALGVTDGIYLDRLWLAVNGGDPTNACLWLTSDTKNAILGTHLHFEGPGVKDDGVGTMGLRKALNLNPAGAVPAPVTAPANRPPPQFIKTPEASGGMVQLSGSAACANTANTVIGLLPPGFRPVADTFFLAFAQDSNYARGIAYLYVDTGGYISLAQAVAGLGAQLTDVVLGNGRWFAPLVP